MQSVTAKDGTAIASSKTTTKLTRALLTCGVIAGPVYIVLGVIQMLIRPGFDIRRHALSLLSNGDLRWIQIANFEVSGLLVIAGALGMRRVLRGSPGATWGSLLLGFYGLFGMIGAGIFSADPALGFPPGTPQDAAAVSWHGMLHFLTGGIGFLCLIAACFVFARRFASLGQPSWAAYSVATGVIFFVAFIGIASGSKGPVSVAFAVAVVLAWVWISLIAARLMTELPDLKA